MRWLILGVASIYAYLAVDGAENESQLGGKKNYRARTATVILAIVAAIFAQSANSLEGKLETSKEQTAQLEYQNSLLQYEISNLKLNNNQLQERLNASALSSLLDTPAQELSPGNGATARCVDGTYSYSVNRRGTCSHHEGVAEWYR
jgi:hypothetical protein